MIEEYYNHIQFFVWVLLLVAGSYLLIGKVPCKDSFNAYRKSRKIIGIAFLIYSTQFFLQWKFNARDNYPLVASALNITFFYLAGTMLGGAYIALLDKKYLNRMRIITELSACTLISVAVWFSILFLPSNIALWVLILSALWLFVYMVRTSWVFYSTYCRTVKKIQNYYSDEVASFIRWMSKSVFCAIVMGLLCPIMVFVPKWLIAIYLASSIPFFFYIFVCCIDYIIHYETVDNAIEDEQKELNDETDKLSFSEPLEEQMQAWISAKGYHQPKINMGELAKQMGSNRSYLSSYINSQYSCTFYEWIAGLRIEDAKNLLINEPGLTMVQIAERVGFSSGSHFTHLFTEKEKISPSQWREKHMAV